jgi:tRNA pseudouridine55 synthase
MSAPRSTRVEVNGWVILDKPVGLTSTQAVSRLKRLYNAKKAGHAGTLDPLASGVLPVAFGEATKTVPFVQDGEKAYRFTVQWGVETDTDDTEGHAVHTSDARPDVDAIAALLPRFTGEIMQKPPAFSAIKINGERAYDLARDGEAVDLAPRPITIHALRLVSVDRDHAVLEAECGKGTYVRAIARDLGRALGCYGHVVALRRTRVGPFLEAESAPLAELMEAPDQAHEDLLGVEAGLSELPCILLDRNAAGRARRGQSVILRGRDAPAKGAAYAVCGGVVIASGLVERGEFLPNRVFNLPY